MRKKKKILLVIITITLLLIGYLALYYFYPTSSENYYFIRFTKDGADDKSYSYIYHYNADNNETKQVGIVEGQVVKSIINSEQNELIGFVRHSEGARYVIFDIEEGVVTKEIKKAELEEFYNGEILNMEYSLDFSDNGQYMYYIQKDDENTNLYSYDLMNDVRELIVEDVVFYEFNYKEGCIYHIKGGDIYRYSVNNHQDECLVSTDSDIESFQVSPDGSKILIHDQPDNFYRTLNMDKLYIYDIGVSELNKVESAILFNSSYVEIAWNGNDYIYVQDYYGIIAGINPQIKVNRSFISDKVIYRINGFMKGGTLYLVENPGQ